jgi:transcriptional regulator with XRE-family HTH domain
MILAVTARERPVDRGRREGADLRRVVAVELRQARVSHNLSLTAVAAAVGCSASQLSRLERGSSNLSIERIATIAAVLGLRASLRLYPVGQPIRDRAQLQLLDRLRRRVNPSLEWRSEVAIPIPGDLRAWDAAISGPGWTVAVDAETRIVDVQALERRISLKRRDSGIDKVILLLSETRTNRAVVGAAGAGLQPGSIPAREALVALRLGHEPRGSAVVLR